MAEPLDGSSETRRPGSVTALVWAPHELRSWLPALHRLLDLPDVERVLVATESPTATALLPVHDRIDLVPGWSFASTVGALPATVDGPVLLLTSPVMLPEVGLGTALDALADDGRVAVVSFLCNAAGYLSFPHRNRQVPYALEGHDETTLTRLLRSTEPLAAPAPIAAPAGPATLVSRDCLIVTRGPDSEYDVHPPAAVVDMALRAARRGFRIVLDPATYLTRLWEGAHWPPDPLDEPGWRQRLAVGNQVVLRLQEIQSRRAETPLGRAWHTARAKVRGLRILIDASCLGPIENGTQVQTLALVQALARRDDVKWVGLMMAGRVPRYAEKTVEHPKVRTVKTSGLRLPKGGPRADVLHRPFQPTGPLPWGNWRGSADRTLVTLQDLIAYGVGAYHDDPPTWMRYRNGIQSAVAKADGLVVISHDVRTDVGREQLPSVAERTFVVENGTDHLAGDEPESLPAELLARGWSAREFLVVLGANYSHKNRDLAIRAYDLLRQRRPSLGLVLAGVAVAEGSSRVVESVELAGVDGVVTLPDVTSEERNWLLRHASLCVYPSSAEGFGLVPFEAARFGTPTLFTRFGPLAEVLDGVPVAAETWDPVDLAECGERLLADPRLAADQVAATLKCGTRYTWDETAERLVSAYRELLARPARVEARRVAK